MQKIKRIGHNKFHVQSGKDKNKHYLVDLNINWCDCRSFYFTKQECKHMKMVREFLRENGQK